MEEENFENKAPRGSIAQIIFKALESGDKYGYEICKEIENLTQGKLILKQPSLYSCLRRMEEQGLISSYWEDSDLGGKRHYYSITEMGNESYEENKKDWKNDEELINSLPLNVEFDFEENDESELYEEELPSPTFVANQESLFKPTKSICQDDELQKENKEKNIDNQENNSFFQFDLFNENVSFIKNENSETKSEFSQFENKFLDLDNSKDNIEPFEKEEIKPENNLSQQENGGDIIKRNEVLNNENHSVKKENDSKISWDDSHFDNQQEMKEDYKDVIGQLYSNSRLPDPYEQNKYQNFKEIFPTSKFEEQKAKEIYEERNSNIENLIKSSQESNIDCEDMKNLNDLYKLQGIEIKLHQKKENFAPTKTYTDKNKLNMVSALIISLIMLLEIMFSYIILRNAYLINGKQRIIFYLSLALILSFALISSLENLFDKYRLIVIEKKFKKSFMQRLFLFIFLIVIIFALNIVGGMTSLTQSSFLCYWIIPTLLSTNILLYSIVYYSLLKSKTFSK